MLPHIQVHLNPSFFTLSPFCPGLTMVLWFLCPIHLILSVPGGDFKFGEQFPSLSGPDRSQVHPIHRAVLSYTSACATLNEILTYAEPPSLWLQHTSAISSRTLTVEGGSWKRVQCRASVAGAQCVHGVPRLELTLGMLKTRELWAARETPICPVPSHNLRTEEITGDERDCTSPTHCTLSGPRI